MLLLYQLMNEYNILSHYFVELLMMILFICRPILNLCEGIERSAEEGKTSYQYCMLLTAVN
jgi:hypothetical protein